MSYNILVTGRWLSGLNTVPELLKQAIKSQFWIILCLGRTLLEYCSYENFDVVRRCKRGSCLKTSSARG